MIRDQYHSLRRINEALKKDSPMSEASKSILEEIVAKAMEEVKQRALTASDAKG